MATRRVWRHPNGFKWMAIERFNNCENIVALAKELGRYGQFLQRAPNHVPLTVPKGTAVQVVLDREVRIQKVGQAVHGRVAEPVYVFDKLVVPVGTEVSGQITELEGVSAGRRTLDALNAEFTPARKVQIKFDALEPSDGRRIPIQPIVTPGSGQVIQFATAADPEKKRA